MSNADKRNAIIAKVQALLTKTVENGCTESEAMAAAEKAAKLMEEYDLTYTDLETEVRGDTYGERKRAFGRQSRRRVHFHEVRGVARSIGEFWDCRSYTYGADLCFFGEKRDTENAFAMLDLIRAAMDMELAAYLRSPDRPNVNGHRLRASFMVAMAIRLNERLEEIKRSRSAASATGTALVVLKDKIVAEKLRAHLGDTRIRTGRSRVSVHSEAAFRAGYEAGNRVGLGGRAELGK